MGAYHRIPGWNVFHARTRARMLMTASARGFSSTSATLLQHAIGIYEGEYGRHALTIRLAALLHLDEVSYDVM